MLQVLSTQRVHTLKRKKNQKSKSLFLPLIFPPSWGLRSPLHSQISWKSNGHPVSPVSLLTHRNAARTETAGAETTPVSGYASVFLHDLSAFDRLADPYSGNPPAPARGTLCSVLHVCHAFEVALVDSSFSVFFLSVDVSRGSNSLLSISKWTAHLKLNYKSQCFIFSSFHIF